MDNTWQTVIDGLHDGTAFLSHSALWEFNKSPLHFMQYKLKQKEQTPSMLFGSMVHCLVLEPDDFDNRFVSIPEDAPRRPTSAQLNAKKPSEESVKSIEWWSAFNAANEGKTIISADDKESAEKIKNAIYKNQSSKFVLDRVTETEVGITWENEGFNFRGFIDGRGDVVMDLKILADASPRKAERYIMYEGPLWQAAHYTKGGKAKGEYYIVVADRLGHVSVFNIGQNTINAAWEDIFYCMNRFKKCLILDQWDQSYDFSTPSGIYNL